MKNTLMKKGLLFVIAVSFCGLAYSQSKDIQGTQLYKHYQMKYVFGMKYNDGDVAKDALYSLLAMDPNDDSIKMRLCYYYYENNQYAPSLFVSLDLLARQPDNVDALRINALSYENMGIRDKATAAYETLYLQTNEIGVLYQVSILQFEQERYTECKTNLDIILKDPQAKALKLNFAKNETEQQEITLEAAVYNVKGMIEKQEGNKEEAKKHFSKALEVEPEYALAAENLKDVNK
jgi:tetratricopeptide (TPR) repeat protein